MKEYLAPEFEKIEYQVEDCLVTSSIGKEGGNGDDALNGI